MYCVFFALLQLLRYCRKRLRFYSGKRSPPLGTGFAL